MAADAVVAHLPQADETVTQVLAQPSPLAAFWAAFRENKGAVFGLAVFGAVVLLALAANLVAPYSPIEQFREAVRQSGMSTPDGTLAIVATGSLNERLLRLMVENLPHGTWELVCHPGYNDDDLRRVRTRLRESREQELRILTSSSTRDLMAANGVEIITFGELAIAG